MTLILSGTNGVSDIDGDASTPALRGTDANSGVFFGSDVVGVSTGGSEKVSVGASALVVNDGGADFDFRVEGDTDANLFFVDAGNDRITYGAATISSYQWNSWNPSDLVGSITNAPGTGTADDSRYITQSNASGTLTITFDVAGKYFICITQQTQHSQVFSSDRVTAVLGGTATRRIVYNPQNSGIDSNDTNISISTGFYVSATAAQTLTILPTYELTGSGTTANHVASCSVTAQYCGG